MFSDEILNAGFRSFRIGVADGSRLLGCGALDVGCMVADSSKDPSTFSFSAQLSEKRSALFWDITQRIMVTHYRRFGTTYLSHLPRRAPISSTARWKPEITHNPSRNFLHISPLCFFIPAYHCP
jgi:hypothetical protein